MSDSNSKPANTNPYPLWAPRFWHGMLFTDWMRLLLRHRLRVHPLRWGLATTITIASTFNTKMRVAQVALRGHSVANTPVPDNPIFILGHWRSGTTYLHELLSVDKRFATPTTYQCFAANHFLLTEPVLTRLLWFALPRRRPMDNVSSGWHEPQEDEFALCSKGVPSPYLRMSFPGQPSDEHLDYLDMEIGPYELREWQDALNLFLRELRVCHPKQRIVLKSPTHTGRVGLLAKMFPRAKFIHMVRDPYDIVPSTIRLWNALDEVQGLQMPNYQDTEAYVHRAFERMYGGYHAGRAKIADDRIVDIRYESLVDDTLAEIERAYGQLGLNGFDQVLPDLQQKISEKKDYQKNKHELSPALVHNINQHWGEYFERFGYAVRTPSK